MSPAPPSVDQFFVQTLFSRYLRIHFLKKYSFWVCEILIFKFKWYKQTFLFYPITSLIVALHPRSIFVIESFYDFMRMNSTKLKLTLHWTSVWVFWSPIGGVSSNPTCDKVFHWSQPIAPLSDSDHFPLVTYMTLKRVFHKLFKDIFSDFRFDFFHFRSKQFQAWISPRSLLVSKQQYPW